MTPVAAVQARLNERALAALDDTRAAVDDVRARHGLLDVPTFLAPVVLPASARAAIARATETLHRALARVQRAYFADGRFDDLLQLPEELAPLAVPVAGDPALVACRLDVIADPAHPERFVVVEVQAGDPSGPGWTDVLWTALAATPGVRDEPAPLEPAALIRAQREAALAVYETWSVAHDLRPEAAPHVAFACADDALVRSDHEAFAWLWRRAGAYATVVDPRELVVDDGRVLADGAPVDLLVRDTHDELVLPPFAADTGALRALLARDEVCCVNPLRDALLDDKMGLVALTSPAARDLFSNDELGAIATHVLPTRALRAVSDDWLLTARERLVLKPADGYGGRDVIIGPETAADAWREAVADARSRRTVVQDYAPLPRVSLPDTRGDARERYCALSFWLHGGRFSGAYARLSDDPVVNVHRGGGIVPAVFAG